MNSAWLTNLLLAGILVVLIWDAATHQSQPRFQPIGSDGTTALDTYTGRACFTYKTSTNTKITGPDTFPLCWQIK